MQWSDRVKEPRATARKSQLRRVLGAALAVATAVVLTACGARIDTTMNVGDDGSGSRVMVATLSGADLAKVSNGSAAIDASIQKNLPSELTYSGTAPTADGGTAVTLTLAFASTDDYKKKAEALLGRGGIVEVDIDFAVTDSLLLKGIRIDEDFSSADLLKWLFDGLVADGVVAAADESNMYEVGSTVLNYGGASVSQSGAYDYTTVVDNGFSGISMTTDISDPDKIRRTITYSVAAAKYAADEALYDEFFAQSTPAGADLSARDDGSWEMTFSGDAKAISAATDTATGGTGSLLSVKNAVSSNDPATLTTSVTDMASCENICASDADILDTVTGGTGYTPESVEVDVSGNEPVVFENTPAITTADAKFEFGMFGAVTGTVTFVVPNKSVALVGDGFTTLFKPAKGVGTLTSDRGKNDTTFTTVIKGDDIATFSSAYAQWAPGSLVSAIEGERSSLFGREMSYVINPGLSAILDRHVVTGASTTTVALPLGQSVSSVAGEPITKNGISGTTVTFAGPDASAAFQADGLTFAGLLFIGILIVVLAGLVFLLVRHRRRVLSTMKGARARFTENLDAPGLGSLSAERMQPAGHRVLSTLKGAQARFAESMAAPGLESLSDDRVQPASSARAAGSVFGLTAGSAYSGSQRSIVDWPQHPLGPTPSASLFGVPQTAKEHTRPAGASLFSLPINKIADQIRGTLFAHDDALGDSRPRNNTN